MVNFIVEGNSVHGRVGKILRWGRIELEYKTPSCLIYTRAGHIPHLTWEVATKWLKLLQSPIFQITLPSLYEAIPAIEKLDNGVGAFCGMPKGALLHLSVFDSLTRLDSGFNDSKSIAIWTKAGRRNISVKNYCKILSCCKTGSFETLLDYDTIPGCANKRLTKAVTRTVNFVKEMMEESSVLDKASTFVTLGGGYSAFHREFFAQELGGTMLASGFALDLFPFICHRQRQVRRPVKRKITASDESLDSASDVQINSFKGCEEAKESSDRIDFNTALVDRLIGPVIKKLPPGLPKFAAGPFSPSEVVSLVRLGIDLFDSSFATLLAEEGKLLKLHADFPYTPTYEILDFNDYEKYAEDFIRPFEDCNCYTCSHYTKGYLQHLRNTNELLGPILLTIPCKTYPDGGVGSFMYRPRLCSLLPFELMQAFYERDFNSCTYS